MELHCKYYKIPFDNTLYTCEVVKVTKSATTSEIEVIPGVHMEGKSNEDIEHLRIVSKELKFIPRDLIRWFPNLLDVTIINCGIEKVSREDFIGLGKLKVLNLSHNKLTSLPDDLFADMKNIEEIYFDPNNIKFFSSKILEPIEHKLENFEYLIDIRITNLYHEHVTLNKDLTKFKESVDAKFRPSVVMGNT